MADESRMADEMLLARASPICSKEATYPGHMIRFWCDSEITFLRGLHEEIGDSIAFLYTGN